MKDYQYHLINAMIAGFLVFFGSLIPLLNGDMNMKSLGIGAAVGFVTGMIIFLNKVNDYIKTSDECQKNLKMVNFL